MTKYEKKQKEAALIISSISIIVGIIALCIGQFGLVFIGLVLICGFYDIEIILKKIEKIMKEKELK